MAQDPIIRFQLGSLIKFVVSSRAGVQPEDVVVTSLYPGSVVAESIVLFKSTLYSDPQATLDAASTFFRVRRDVLARLLRFAPEHVL